MAKIRTGLSSSEITRQVAGRKRRPRGPVRPLGSWGQLWLGVLPVFWREGRGGTWGTWLLSRPVCLGGGEGGGQTDQGSTWGSYPSWKNPPGPASLPCGCQEGCEDERKAREQQWGQSLPTRRAGSRDHPPPCPRSSNKGKGCDSTLPLCLRLLLNLCSFGRLNLSAWFIEAAAWAVSRTK